MHAFSVVSNSLRPKGLQPTTHLCPWDSRGNNTGMGCHFLLQGIFLTQGSNPGVLCLLHWQANSLSLSHLGSPQDLVIYPICTLAALGLQLWCGALCCGAQAFSSCSMWAFPVAAHGLSSPTRDQNRIPCIGRQILKPVDHQGSLYLNIFFLTYI